MYEVIVYQNLWPTGAMFGGQYAELHIIHQFDYQHLTTNV